MRNSCCCPPPWLLPGHRHHEPCDSDGMCQVRWVPTMEDVARRAPEEANEHGFAQKQNRALTVRQLDAR